MGVQDIDKLIETIDSMKEHGVIKNRIDKMKSIMSEIDKDGNVKLNFYDSKRIATWTNQFPSIIIWVNE